MAVKQSKDTCNVNLINNYIGTAYDHVVVVAENIDTVKEVVEGIGISLRYLGAWDTAPTTRLDGSPLEEGDYYLNTEENAILYYNNAAIGPWLKVDPAEAIQAKDEAVAARDVAVIAKDSAENSAEAASIDAASASASATNAADSASNASNSANFAVNSAISAGNSATSADNSYQLASDRADAAQIAAINAQNSEDVAAASADTASSAATCATSAKDTAVAAQQAAKSSETAAANSASSAAADASAAEVFANSASASADEASTSASNAATSASSASSSASSASASASTATAAKDTAVAKASEATSSAAAALASEQQASAAATSATISESNAADSAVEALFQADRAEEYANALGSGVVAKGPWDASSGAFPPTPTLPERAEAYRITVGGLLNTGGPAGQEPLEVITNDLIYWSLSGMAWYRVRISDSLSAPALLDLLKTVDGAGSLLDSDLLDGEEGTFYRNATNINAGTLNAARLPTTIPSDTTGNAATAAKWQTARCLTVGSTAKAVDGSANVAWSLAEIGAAPASHTHSYLPLSGGTLTGSLKTKDIEVASPDGTSSGSIINTDDGNLEISAPYGGGLLLNYNSGTSGVSFGNGEGGASAYVDNQGTFNAYKYIAFGNFEGPLVGNATTATTLETARTINGTSFNGSASITTANWGTARNLTIGSTAKSVNGSANVSWTLAEIGAAAASHTHDYAPLTGGGTSGTWPISITGNAATASSTSGNAGSATKLATPRAINGTNFDGTAAITTANWGTARTLTIGSTGKSVNGSANIAWTLAEIGAAAASHTHAYAPLTGTGTSGTWPINVTGNAGTATTATNSNCLGGVAAASYALKTGVGSSGTWPINVTGSAGSASNANCLGGVAAASYALKTGVGSSGTWPISITGNAATATSATNATTANSLSVARTINGTSFNGTANITTANWGTARTLTIGNTSKSVNGSANIEWTLAEIGAAPATGSESGTVAMTQANFEAIRAMNNEQFAASGFVHFGKHGTLSGAATLVNEGLSTATSNQSYANKVWLGAPEWASTYCGGSKTERPFINIAGVITHFDTGADVYNSQAVKFPEAPSGGALYNLQTGGVVDFSKEIDPKYGDIAGTLREAAGRAQEGLPRNGDFRLDVPTLPTTSEKDWFIAAEDHSGASIANGVYTWTSTGPDTYTRQIITDTVLREGRPESIRLGGYLESWTGTSTDAPEVQLYYNGGRKSGRTLSVGRSSSQSYDITDWDGVSDFEIRIRSQAAGTMVIKNVDCHIYETHYEVVTDRVDMWGFEAWLEEVTEANPFVYPNGLIQSQATTMNGLNTVTGTRPVTYYAVYDGDTSSVGKGVDFFAATQAERDAILADHKNNLYYLADGRLVQWRLRQRTIAGAKNGDWEVIDSTTRTKAVRFTEQSYVQPQGLLDASLGWGGGSDNFYSANPDWKTDKYLGAFQASVTSNPNTDTFGINGECYFLVCGTVLRLNQGAYHPIFNPLGSARFDDGGYWYDNTDNIGTTLDCFTSAGDGSITGAASGRPDDRYYDAIYAEGQGGVCRDMRYKASGLTAEDFAEADLKAKQGKYRGYQELPYTRIFGNVTAFTKTSAATWSEVGGGRFNIPINSSSPWPSLTQKVVTNDVNNIYQTILVGGNGKTFIVEAELQRPFYGEISRFGNTMYAGIGPEEKLAEFNATFPYGTTIRVVQIEKKRISVGGKFSQIDVLGSLEQITATPLLADGWEGSWIPQIPNGVESKFYLVRKSLNSSVPRVYTANNGTTWSSDTTVINTTDNASVKDSWQSNEIVIHSYPACAYQTEPAANTAVFEGYKGIGSVYQNAAYNLAFLTESLINKILKGSINNGGDQQQLSKVAINSSGRLTSSNHNSIDLSGPSNQSPAVKALDYNVNLNQQGFKQYAATELVWSGSNWGDDGKVTIVARDSAKNDLNNNAVKVVMHKLKEPIGWIKNTK
jgi:hypothetical protein